MKRALICGVGGQDGSYLARFLLDKGYVVLGTSRDAQTARFENLDKLGIRDQIKTFSMLPNDFRSVLQVISQTRPDEIYNLSGQSSVGLSFEQPVETMESIAIANLNFLESIRFLGRAIRFYNAGSSECFGNVKDPATELTPFKPRSPYAVAKSTAHWQVENYREAYNLFACTGMLFNHESILRPMRFVTRKIVETARRIAEGSHEKLKIGNIAIVRDWGWAPEFVEAMWLILQQDKPDDFIIATGKSVTLKEFTEQVFAAFDMNWSEHVIICDELFRPTDLNESRANPAKASEILGWNAVSKIEDVVRNLVEGVI